MADQNRLKDYAQQDAEATYKVAKMLDELPRPRTPPAIYIERTLRRMTRLLSRLGRSFTLHGHAVDLVKHKTDYALTYTGAHAPIQFGDGHVRINGVQVPVRKRGWRASPRIFAAALVEALKKGGRDGGD